MEVEVELEEDEGVSAVYAAGEAWSVNERPSQLTTAEEKPLRRQDRAQGIKKSRCLTPKGWWGESGAPELGRSWAGVGPELGQIAAGVGLVPRQAAPRGLDDVVCPEAKIFKAEVKASGILNQSSPAPPPPARSPLLSVSLM